tara:strand:+ start:312 stop:635 length:324 start_codon:yes stop_codon:yes gene_type:complete
MAFAPAPSGWFPGLTNSASDVTIPFTALNGITEAATEPDTGDIRDIVYNFCEAFSDQWASTASDDRPEKTTISTSASITTSGGSEVLTKIYTIRVELDVDAVSVSDE